MYSHVLQSKLDQVNSSQTLHVIAVISNPVRYKKRYELYEMFERHMLGFDVNLITVELAFGERSFFITNRQNPNHIQLRTWDELWHKENMINVGFQHLSRQYPDWQYVAWIDADVQFIRTDWVEQTKEALQHHMIVQPWSDCIDMGPNGELIDTHKSFCHQFVELGRDGLLKTDPNYYGMGGLKPAFAHPGYGWAARREAIDGIGGLLDRCIMGSGDHHQAWAWVGDVMKSCPGNVHPNYIKMLRQYQDRSELILKRDLGYVKGTIYHHFHGKKKDRKYQERWGILQQHKYDPELDVLRDSAGIVQLAGNKIGLRDAVRQYMRGRNEDSIDLV